MSSAGIATGVLRGAYPEREDPKPSTLDALGEKLAAPVTRRLRTRKQHWEGFPELVAAHEDRFETLREEELAPIVEEVRNGLRERGFEDEPVAQAFALVRELASRILEQRHYDVQLVGGWLLLHGMVAEMETGEGKTLTATLPAATAALAGVPVHVVTVNDYLASRDAEWMTPLYRALGLTVGVIVGGMEPADRRAAYACDITYCTNKEVAFDYLKDRIALGGRPTQLQLRVEKLARGNAPGRTEQLVHRGLHFAIVDEADSILVDEARTPLIISERKSDAAAEETYRTALALAGELDLERDFSIQERERRIDLSEEGCAVLAELAETHGGLFSGPRRREELVRQALSALHLFVRDQHYLVHEEKVQIIDEYTGRTMPDRSWEQGLHQMIEMKEGVPITGRQDTRARISYQRFFHRYLRLSGMTGTAQEVSPEMWSVYGLPVVKVPSHRRLARRDLGEQVFATAEEKWDAVVARIAELHAQRRPVLVGTRSVAASEIVSARLDAAGIPHRVLNARQDREEAEIVAQAGEPGRVTVATNMAGRGTDIRLSKEVKRAGGLHVLATERHESRRIDRQLYGRCGRQGDPGSFEAMVSLEDELMQVHGGAVESWLAGAAGPAGSKLGDRLRRVALRRAQKAAGRLHARVRRELYKQDGKLDSLLGFSGRPE